MSHFLCGFCHCPRQFIEQRVDKNTRGLKKSQNRNNGECYAANQAELRAKLARGSAGFGDGPNKQDFSGFGGGGTWKIRKCIDTCIACRLAQHTNAQQYLRIIKYHVQNCSLVSYVSI